MKDIEKKGAKTRKGRGRPSIYSDKLIQVILTRLSCGELLINICRDEAMPHLSTIYRWREERPEIKEMFKRARDCQSETLLEEVIEISDSSEEVATHVPSGAAEVAAKKLRVDARLKIIGRFSPDKFGERQNIAGVEGKPLNGPITFDQKQMDEFKDAQEKAMETIRGKVCDD